MNKMTLIRRALPGAAILSAALALAAWAGTRGSGSPADQNGAATADPHAGHDMGGIVVAADGTVSIPAETARSLGLRIATAELGAVRKGVRATGQIAYDETRLTTLAPRVGGFVERLHMNTTGQPVRRGQPVLELYSPDLVAAQEELLAALRLEAQLAASAAPGVAARSRGLADAARRKLLLWDISPAQVQQIESSGQVRRTLTLHAPFGGFVVEKLVQAGQAVDAGMPLYRLADLSSVWLEADVYEQDLRFVRVGETARIELAAYAGEALAGRIAYVYPEVRSDTRTARVRIELANPAGRVMPGMFATVDFETTEAERAVLVPRDAVMLTGTRALVFVEVGPGSYEPRDVRVGGTMGERTQILSGLLAGERVVGRANFLLDAESRLMETMGAIGDMPGMQH
jgi:membrane fusion protein, copper/silver efflux system